MKISKQLIGQLSIGLIIVFVVVGLTGALGVENLKQGSDDEKEETELLRLMIEDLKKDNSFLLDLSVSDSIRFEKTSALHVKLHYKKEITTDELSMTFAVHFLDFNSSRFAIDALTFSRSLG